MLGCWLLVRENGTVLARYPSNAACAGRAIRTAALFRALLCDASVGIDFTRSLLDGVKRVNAFHRVDRYQLMAIVGLSNGCVEGLMPLIPKAHRSLNGSAVDVCTDVRRSDPYDKRV